MMMPRWLLLAAVIAVILPALLLAVIGYVSAFRSWNGF